VNSSILIVLENYPAYGGVERVTTLLANYLAGIGRKVTIVSIRGLADDGLFRALAPNVLCYSLPVPTKINGAENRRFLNDLIRVRGITVVINQGLHFQLTQCTLVVARQSGCRYISVLHNTPDAHAHILDATFETLRKAPATGLKQHIKRIFWNSYRAFSIRRIGRFYGKVYRGSDRLVLLSDSFSNNFCKIAGIDGREKLSAIPNPLTFDDEVRLADLNKKKKIIYMGRFDKVQKRVDRAVRIFKALHDKYPDWNLYLIGDGAQLAELKQLSEGVATIHFCGNLADPREHLRDASILLLTSEFEGFGMVLTEALQFGVVPVSYASYSAIHDIIVDGSNGYAVAPFDQDLFIQRLDGLMRNRDLLGNMAARAIESSAAFRKDAVFRRWLPVVDSQ
jgi:glycosyltransferase involved in cell wall biosynthesis